MGLSFALVAASDLENISCDSENGLGPIVSKLLSEFQNQKDQRLHDTRRVVGALNNMTD